MVSLIADRYTALLKRTV